MPTPHNIYRGGSRPLERNCGAKGTCPANRRLISKLHYERNKSTYIERANAQPREQTRAAKKRWKENNPAAVAKSTADRKEYIRTRTPSWLTDAHHAEMLAVYAEARRITAETGIEHEVDHIIPLRNKLVSGLHVPWNLRVIPSEENQKKNNKLLD